MDNIKHVDIITMAMLVVKLDRCVLLCATVTHSVVRLGHITAFKTLCMTISSSPT